MSYACKKESLAPILTWHKVPVRFIVHSSPWRWLLCMQKCSEVFNLAPSGYKHGQPNHQASLGDCFGNHILRGSKKVRETSSLLCAFFWRPKESHPLPPSIRLSLLPPSSVQVPSISTTVAPPSPPYSPAGRPSWESSTGWGWSFLGCWTQKGKQP